MIAAVRIRGLVGVRKDIDYTLKLLKLRRKFHCIVIPEEKSFIGMLKKCKDYITWGKISEETFKELVTKRGKKTIETEKDKEIEKEESKKKSKIIGPFRLSPPRKGLKSIRLHYPKGDLGEREEIDSLLKRMI